MLKNWTWTGRFDWLNWELVACPVWFKQKTVTAPNRSKLPGLTGNPKNWVILFLFYFIFLKTQISFSYLGSYSLSLSDNSLSSLLCHWKFLEVELNPKFLPLSAQAVASTLAFLTHATQVSSSLLFFCSSALVCCLSLFFFFWLLLFFCSFCSTVVLLLIVP